MTRCATPLTATDMVNVAVMVNVYVMIHGLDHLVPGNSSRKTHMMVLTYVIPVSSGKLLLLVHAHTNRFCLVYVFVLAKAGNCSTSFRNETTKEVIKRYNTNIQV